MDSLPTTEDKIVQEFDVTEAAIAEIGQYKQLEIIDTKSEKHVKKCRQVVRTMRTDIERRRKELKSPVIERGKLIDRTAKELTARIHPTEVNLDEKIKTVEAEREKARQEKLEQEQRRREKIKAALGELYSMATVGGAAYGVSSADIETALIALKKFEVTEEVFQERTEDAEKIKRDGINNTQAALDARLRFEQEQAALEAEKKRLAEEAEKQREKQEAAEAEAKARAKAEAEKRAKEQAKQKAEQDRLEEERKAFEMEKAAAREKEEARIRAEEEKEKTRVRTEQEKQEAEAAEEQRLADWNDAIQENISFNKAVKERQLADQERAKLISVDRGILLNFVDGIEKPFLVDVTFQTDSGQAIYQQFLKLFNQLKSDIKELS